MANANAIIEYELTSSNDKYIERDTFPHESHNEFPAVYGNEDFIFELTFNGRVLLANTAGGTPVEPFTFNVLTGEPLDPSQTIRIDLSPTPGGGYETVTTDVVAYWDDFTNTDFVNGVANTFPGASGFYGNITVYNHKIRWENVQWANWTQPFDLGFFNSATSNFWDTYNANNYPEQIVIYADYNGNANLNISYTTTEPNTAPYFIPPTSDTTVGGANSYDIPTGKITRIEVLNPYPVPPEEQPSDFYGVPYLENDHPAALRAEAIDNLFPNPATYDVDPETGIANYNRYFNKPPAPAWIAAPNTPTFTFTQVDGPRRDDQNNLVTGVDMLASVRIWRYSEYGDGSPINPPVGSQHDDGNYYEWFGAKLNLLDGGKNYAIGDTFEMTMNNPNTSLITSDIPLRWVVRDIEAPFETANVNYISIVSKPNYVDVTVDGAQQGANSVVRFVKNATKIWPEEKYIFQTYANSVFEASATTSANVEYDNANTFYNTADPADTAVLREWVSPDDERQNRTSAEDWYYIFEMNVGDGVNTLVEDHIVTFLQRHYWSTKPGKGIFENVIDDTPQANGTFEDLYAPTISQVQQDYYLFANTYNEMIRNAEDLFGEQE